MRPVSPRFLASVRQSHQVVVNCDLIFPDGSRVTVPVEGGEIAMDRTALIRRSGSVQIPWSLDAGADLGLDLRTLPLGGYAEVSRGIRYPDGTQEYARLGLLRVESVSWLTMEDRASIELADRMAQVRDEPFTVPYAVGGQRVALAAVAIVQQVFGGGISYQAVYNPGIFVSDAYYTGGKDDAVTKLAQSVGGEAYFDASGNFVFDGPPGAVDITRNGNLADESAVVSGLSTTSDLVPGMTVYGLGLVGARRILAVNSASTITLDGKANTYGYKNGQTRAGSKGVSEISDTSDVMAGMTVTGLGIPAGTVVQSIDGPTALTLSKASTFTGNPILYYTAPNPISLEFLGASGSLTNPVWLIDTGERGVMLNADEALDRTGVYNGVLVEGQNTAADAPVSALVYDADPTSPTYWNGPFGHVVRIEQSAAVTSVTQAQQAAQSFLDHRLGLTRSLVLTTAPNPALEAGDVINVRFQDGRDERHVIDALHLDLGPEGSQSLTTRSVYTPAALSAQVPRARRPIGVYTGRRAWREASRARRVRVK